MSKKLTKKESSRQWYQKNKDRRRYHRRKGDSVFSVDLYNQFGYKTMPWNEVVDGGTGGFKQGFTDTCKSLGLCHIMAVMELYWFLHGFYDDKWSKKWK